MKKMKSIKFNSKIVINYSLSGNQKLFETTFDKEPIEIIVGNSGLPQIIEASLYGLKCGDKKQYSFESNDIFGKYDKNKIKSSSIKMFKNYKDVKVGDIIETEKDNKSYFITVLEIKGDEVLIDLNHPLCNKDIRFEVEILEVKNDS
tara:strand:- start:829 stop:1269 length:441 start_codon:yes stop_codon:yes gene_type:complete